MSTDYTDMVIVYEFQTPKAFRLSFEDDNYAKHWVPRSVVRDPNSVDEESTNVEVANWWLEKNSLL